MSDSTPEPPEQPQQPEIVIEPDQLAGRWANLASVSYGEHEFKIDSIRIDPAAPRGIVVSRVSGSGLFVMQLIDTLNRVWHDWASKALPQEVQNAPESPEGDETEPGDSPTSPPEPGDDG